MNFSLGISLYFLVIVHYSHAQLQVKNVYDYNLDLNVEQVIEVQYQFDFNERKCQELGKSIMEFSNDGKVISEEIYKNNKLVEKSNYIYDSIGRPSELQSKLKINYKYVQQGDTLISIESSRIGTKVYHSIYTDHLLDHINIYLDGNLIGKEEFQYAKGKLSGKKVQHFSSDGKKGISEMHKYKNGRTVFFRKRNSKTDDKSCHYYFNSNDGSLDFEETARPGMDAVISKDCNYIYDKDYWVGKSEERFSVPYTDEKLSYKQKHIFYFRKILLRDGTSIGKIRVQKDFVDRFIK